MPAYIVAQLDIRDHNTFARYADLTMPTLDAHEGTLCAADDEAELLEGDWSGTRTVVLRFDSKDAAKAWYESREYQEAALVRRACSSGALVLLDGLD
jgi:uncharacterized protein (DUF1330 family)